MCPLGFFFVLLFTLLFLCLFLSLSTSLPSSLHCSCFLRLPFPSSSSYVSYRISSCLFVSAVNSFAHTYIQAFLSSQRFLFLQYIYIHIPHSLRSCRCLNSGDRSSHVTLIGYSCLLYRTQRRCIYIYLPCMSMTIYYKKGKSLDDDDGAYQLNSLPRGVLQCPPA